MPISASSGRNCAAGAWPTNSGNAAKPRTATSASAFARIPGYDAARRRFELLQERVDVGPQAMRGLCALRQLARRRTDRAARFIGRGGFGWAREKNAKRQGERRSDRNSQCAAFSG